MGGQIKHRDAAIRIEGGTVGFPCQGGDGRCHIPLLPKRGLNGQGWALLSGDGDPITVHPSIDCKACGFHGHIRDGAIEITSTPGDPAKYDAHLAQAFGDAFSDEDGQ